MNTVARSSFTPATPSVQGARRVLPPPPSPSTSASSPAPRARVVSYADRGPGFSTGFFLGGLVFGALGVLFAPQISRALLGEDDRLRMPSFGDEELEPATRENLTSKISQLNAAIDDVSSQLKNTQAAMDQTEAQSSLS